MDFLDRRNELGRLDAWVARRAAGLVALWGRRRVGKTRLLTEWCHRHSGVYTVADQSAEPVQRRYFAEAIAGRLQGFGDSDYPGWLPLLRRLSRDARTANWRGPLVARPLPPRLPSQTRRVLFVPRTPSSVTVTTHGVRVIDADAVMKALV